VSWQDDYRAAMQNAVLHNGSFVRQDGGQRSQYFGGWADYENDVWLMRHVRSGTCELTLGSIRETQWTEFMGTFYEGDETQHGVEVDVSCACGYVTNRTVRWESTLGGALRELLK